MPFPLQEISEMGQQNLVGGKCDKAWFFMVRLVAVKESDKWSAKQKKNYISDSVRAMGGCLRNILTYESVWYE